MRFTSFIVRLVNSFIKAGHTRSSATKKAFQWAKVQQFEAALATGNVVTVFFGKKEAVATGSGAVEQRDCISLTAAVEKGMFKIEGTGRNIPAHCCGFFDLTIESDTKSANYGKAKGPRMFLRDNYIGFKM